MNDDLIFPQLLIVSMVIPALHFIITGSVEPIIIWIIPNGLMLLCLRKLFTYQEAFYESDCDY